MDSNILIIICILAPVLLVLGMVLRQIHLMSRKEADAEVLSLLQNQINANVQQTSQQMEQLRHSMQQIHQQMSQSLESSRKTIDERLDGAAKVIHGVSKQLGQMDEAAKRIFDVGKDIATLQETLRSPKLRGNLGELLLGDLLAQIFPPDYYEMQHRFKDGQAVDAVILLQAGKVPVDSKFPLENFVRISGADEESGRLAARKTFLRDVKIHIDAIASKYIRPDEGTFDFALMYIPAENVYYETVIKYDDEISHDSLFSYALAKRVIPVSPNSFYAYLQTILLGLRGMRVEEDAREIMNNLSRLQTEFSKFQDAFRLVGKHLQNSQNQYVEAEKRFSRLESKLEQIDGVTQALGDGAAATLAQGKGNE